MSKILLVDDDPGFANLLNVHLSRNGYEVTVSHLGRPAIDLFRSRFFDLVLVDYNLPDMNGLELMSALKKERDDQPIILITNYLDLRTAVNSIKLGAFEFVTKPVNPDEILITIDQAIRQKDKKESVKQSDYSHEENVDYFVGKGKASQILLEHIELVAPTKMTVLLLGESGTGKEYAARMIHSKSRRAEKPFIAIDCGVLSKDLASSTLFGHNKGAFTGALSDKKGSFELANEGTIFLDEIGNLSYDVQMQLLRAIQERSIRRLGSDREVSVDVRIIVATNENLKQEVDDGNFRTDLYHRVNEFEIQLPPLRERVEDIEGYINWFFEKACDELDKKLRGLSPGALTILKSYSWPGNLREMKNVIKRGVLLSTGDIMTVDQLPPDLLTNSNRKAAPLNTAAPKTTDLKSLHAQQERELIIDTLVETHYNKSKTAQILNVDRKTLYAKIRKYNIEA